MSRFQYAVLWMMLMSCAGVFVQAEDIVTTPSEITQDEREFYEKLGLSMNEWKMIKSSGMPLKKVYELREAGISVNEYFDRPWEQLDIGEKEWIKKRRRGLTDEDIRHDYRYERTESQKMLLQNIFLPGFNQLERKQYVRGISMTTIAVASLALGGVALQRNFSNKQQFTEFPIFFFMLLPADMFWSAVDLHMQIQKEINPAVNRFTSDSAPVSPGFVGLALRISLPPSTSR
ncbi:MAG: hypothetical protein GF398_18590 [Chitinivibrionales bacterium]|nr:hypothetical protein [Chitinivibrionales bacterium]